MGRGGDRNSRGGMCVGGGRGGQVEEAGGQRRVAREEGEESWGRRRGDEGGEGRVERQVEYREKGSMIGRD